MNEIHFRLNGQKLSKPRLYDVCGVPNVYLLNGYNVIDRNGEEYVSIKDVSGLHRAISKHIVLTHKALTPEEAKFIRKTLDLTQSDIAQKLGVNVQSVARWEKGQCEMPGTADKLLRVVFLAENISNESDQKTLQNLITTVLDDLDAMDQDAPPQANFKLVDTWTEVPLKAA